jgi:hypothetical protein
MWDLDELIRRNNEAALSWMMSGKHFTDTLYPHPDTWPLSLIACKMQSGPISLAALSNLFSDSGVNKQFLYLIREYLTPYEKEIMTKPKNRRVNQFCKRFSEKYYPMPAHAYTTSIGNLSRALPVEIFGLSYSSYHDLDFRTGYLLLMSLVVYPFEDDPRDEENDAVPFNPEVLMDDGKYKPTKDHLEWLENLIGNLSIGGKWIAPMGFTITRISLNEIELSEAEDTEEVKETIRRTLLIAKRLGIKAVFKTSGRTAEEKMVGARVPLIDKVQGMLGVDISSRILKNGWTPEELHEITDNTKYDGCGHFADWACGMTGCEVLDHNYDDCIYMDGWNDPVFKWSLNNIKTLTQQSRKVGQIREKIDHIVDWLEREPERNFRELVNYIADNYQPREKRQDITGHQLFDLIGLEMEDDEDDFNANNTDSR